MSEKSANKIVVDPSQLVGSVVREPVMRLDLSKGESIDLTRSASIGDNTEINEVLLKDSKRLARIELAGTQALEVVLGVGPDSGKDTYYLVGLSPQLSEGSQELTYVRNAVPPIEITNGMLFGRDKDATDADGKPVNIDADLRGLGLTGIANDVSRKQLEFTISEQGLTITNTGIDVQITKADAVEESSLRNEQTTNQEIIEEAHEIGDVAVSSEVVVEDGTEAPFGTAQSRAILSQIEELKAGLGKTLTGKLDNNPNEKKQEAEKPRANELPSKALLDSLSGSETLEVIYDVHAEISRLKTRLQSLERNYHGEPGIDDVLKALYGLQIRTDESGKINPDASEHINRILHLANDVLGVIGNDVAPVCQNILDDTRDQGSALFRLSDATYDATRKSEDTDSSELSTDEFALKNFSSLFEGLIQGELAPRLYGFMDEFHNGSLEKRRVDSLIREVSQGGDEYTINAIRDFTEHFSSLRDKMRAAEYGCANVVEVLESARNALEHMRAVEEAKKAES